MAEIINATTEAFDQVIGNGDKPVLVDFWAPWCGPCKAIAPILEELSTELGDQAQIAKVNVDDNQEVAAKYGIRAIPTLLIFKGGQKVDEIVGLTSKEDLKAKLVAQV